MAFTGRAIDWFASHGVSVERIMTDNGSAYRSHVYVNLLRGARISHKRTRPYTPRTNGKAERFIQTSLREWAYAQPFETTTDRAQAMLPGSPTTTPTGRIPRSAARRRSAGSSAAPLPPSPIASDTADPQPRFVGVAGVKPRAATAAGGLGLTPATPRRKHNQQRMRTTSLATTARPLDQWIGFAT